MRPFGKRGRDGGRAMSAAVISLFILQSRMLYVGGGYVEGQWRGGFLTTAVALAFAILIMPLLGALTELLFADEERGSVLGRLLRFTVSLVASVGAALVGVSLVRSGAAFVSEVMGIDLPRALSALVILAVGGCMAASGIESVKKFSLVTLIITALSSVGLLILARVRGGVSGNEIKELFSADMLAEATQPRAILTGFLSVFAPCAVGAVWLSSASDGRKKVKGVGGDTLLGIALGGGGLISAFLTVLLSRGLAYSASGQYPYVSAVGSMTAGKLFMRPEGIVYVSYIFALLSSLAVCLSLVSRFADGGRSRRTPFVVAAVMLVIFALTR